jgi:hypothetical protein
VPVVLDTGSLDASELSAIVVVPPVIPFVAEPTVVPDVPSLAIVVVAVPVVSTTSPGSPGVDESNPHAHANVAAAASLARPLTRRTA